MAADDVSTEVASMEGSGGESESNPDYVRDLGAGHVEVGRNLGEAIAGLEAIDQILDPRAAVHDHRLAERLHRVDRDLGSGVGRQAQARGPTVVTVGDGFRESRITSAKCS